MIGIHEYERLRLLAEQAEGTWLGHLADKAESEGFAGSVALEEMAAMLRDHHA